VATVVGAAVGSGAAAGVGTAGEGVDTTAAGGSDFGEQAASRIKPATGVISIKRRREVRIVIAISFNGLSSGPSAIEETLRSPVRMIQLKKLASQKHMEVCGKLLKRRGSTNCQQKTATRKLGPPLIP
jgi:hypothetical protein